MSKIKLNRVDADSLENLNIIIDNTDTPFLPQCKWGYNDHINSFRNKIDNIPSELWKQIRWYINEYDFLVREPIINRAFFKYWEILAEFDFFSSFDHDDIILHCAEAPGGFIQATSIYLQKQHPKQKKVTVDDDGFVRVHRHRKIKKNNMVFTISLNKDLEKYKHFNLPSYNKTILDKSLCVSYGVDNTGDINKWENIRHISTLTKPNELFHIITADGGFDEGTDFNNKEQLHYELILSEIYAAIKLQKQGGNFVLKMFDIFTDSSVHFLFLLCGCYDEVFVYKPKTSRPTNSEKYIICKGFNIEQSIRDKVVSKLEAAHLSLRESKRQAYIKVSLFDQIPISFQESVSEMNKIILQKQCSYLKHALTLCDNSDFIKNYELYVKGSLEKRARISREWQVEYNLNI
jgi:23S rRNA U2552 (ribose-2'-O)-methylase RlmE/FtsJ